jgi:hypothetical protein
MMYCLRCGRGFTPCIGSYFEWEAWYCTEECWKASPEYKETITMAADFLNSLTKEQLDAYEELTSISNDYTYIIQDMVLERRVHGKVKV